MYNFNIILNHPHWSTDLNNKRATKEYKYNWEALESAPSNHYSSVHIQLWVMHYQLWIFLKEKSFDYSKQQFKVIVINQILYSITLQNTKELEKNNKYAQNMNNNRQQ